MQIARNRNLVLKKRKLKKKNIVKKKRPRPRPRVRVLLTPFMNSNYGKVPGCPMFLDLSMANCVNSTWKAIIQLSRDIERHLSGFQLRVEHKLWFWFWFYYGLRLAKWFNW